MLGPWHQNVNRLALLHFVYLLKTSNARAPYRLTVGRHRRICRTMSEDVSDLIGERQSSVAVQPKVPSHRNAKHVPTLKDQKFVMAGARFGMPLDVMAKALDIDVETLRARYHEILEKAEPRAIARVAEALFARASRGDTGAIALWLKTRMRRHAWIDMGANLGEDSSQTNITIQVDAAQAISQLFASLKRDADPPRARIIEQAPEQD